MVERGALADLLVVADIALLEKPDASPAMVIKGGRICKSTVES